MKVYAEMVVRRNEGDDPLVYGKKQSLFEFAVMFMLWVFNWFRVSFWDFRFSIPKMNTEETKVKFLGVKYVITSY